MGKLANSVPDVVTCLYQSQFLTYSALNNKKPLVELMLFSEYCSSPLAFHSYGLLYPLRHLNLHFTDSTDRLFQKPPEFQTQPQ